jgi:methionyl-tRNA synthetase
MALIGFIGLESLPSWVNILILVAILWTIPWKAVALWKSARNKQKIWFILFMVLNTLGILEIFYIVYWQKNKNRR